jgi:hypothetical protein
MSCASSKEHFENGLKIINDFEKYNNQIKFIN